ncbi:MAG: F0F1 ATP synthase subunit delta [Desulfobacterales bacterium]|nr:F0F1 ATP synthase subunit delta [Desulfobacterales bacterium]MCP4162386.1 F0F1 ATP synthase subunit delta [Deltaproteobacteria bacterium]
MKNIAISRRYANALMLIGKEDGQADKYKDELDMFSGILENNSQLKMAVCNPLFGKVERKAVLVAVLEKLNLTKTMNSFFMILFDKGRLEFLSDINEFYQQLADEIKGVAHASVTSATELSAEALDKIKASLAKRIGKDVVLDVKHDPELIGGVVTKIGDLVLDGSIKTQLLKMRESFKKGESV